MKYGELEVNDTIYFYDEYCGLVSLTVIEKDEKAVHLTSDKYEDFIRSVLCDLKGHYFLSKEQAELFAFKETRSIIIENIESTKGILESHEQYLKDLYANNQHLMDKYPEEFL